MSRSHSLTSSTVSQLTINDNLFKIGYAVNQTLWKNPIHMFPKKLFKIADPTKFKIHNLRKATFEKLVAKLTGKVMFETSHIPSGYSKRQYTDLYSITLDYSAITTFCNNVSVKLKSYGSSFGCIIVNDLLECELSHSGQSYFAKENELGIDWIDHTDCWHICSNQLELFKILISSSKNLSH